MDLTALLPGPYCTMLLAAMGAKVLKVENPKSGDPDAPDAPGAFEYLNAQKELLNLDLKSGEAARYSWPWPRSATWWWRASAPAWPPAWGVDFDSLAQANGSINLLLPFRLRPKRALCRAAGPRHQPHGRGGAFWPFPGSPPSGKPEYPYGPQYSDLVGALFGANAILATLLGRGPDSEACFLDISLTESAGMLVMPRYLDFLQRGRPGKEEFMRRGPYEVFETRDHKFLTLGIVEDHFWVNFCQAAGLPELAYDPDLQGWDARNRRAGRLKPLLEEAFKKRDRADWLELLSAADVPAAPVHGMEEWASDPQLLSRGFFRPATEGGDSMAAMPRLPLPGLGGPAQGADPEMPQGRDTEKWLLAQGMNPQEIASLREQKII